MGFFPLVSSAGNYSITEVIGPGNPDSLQSDRLINSVRNKMILLVLLIILIGLILWIVFMPVHLKVNTDLSQYEVSQTGTLRIVFHPWQRPAVSMWIFGFRINTDRNEKMKDRIARYEKKKRTIKRSPSAWLYLLQGIYHSFRLKTFVCAVDLDDVVMNAKLVPVVLLLNRGMVSLSTNFTNRNFIYLNLQLKVNKLLWTTFRFYTKK